MSRRTLLSPAFLIPLLVVLVAMAVWTIRASTQGRPPPQVALADQDNSTTPPPQTEPTDTEQPLAAQGPDTPDSAAGDDHQPEQDAHSADDEADDGFVDISELDAAEQIGEERYIQISVRFVIAAIGFQNAGQGNEELAEYLPDLLAKEGVTLAAFEAATDQISSDPEQADRVAGEIVKRVQLATGIQMDVNLLPMFDAPSSSD